MADEKREFDDKFNRLLVARAASRKGIYPTFSLNGEGTFRLLVRCCVQKEGYSRDQIADNYVARAGFDFVRDYLARKAGDDFIFACLSSEEDKMRYLTFALILKLSKSKKLNARVITAMLERTRKEIARINDLQIKPDFITCTTFFGVLRRFGTKEDIQAIRTLEGSYNGGSHSVNQVAEEAIKAIEDSATPP